MTLAFPLGHPPAEGVADAVVAGVARVMEGVVAAAAVVECVVDNGFVAPDDKADGVSY